MCVLWCVVCVEIEVNGVSTGVVGGGAAGGTYDDTGRGGIVQGERHIACHCERLSGVKNEAHRMSL